MYLVLYNFDFVPSIFMQCLPDLQQFLSISVEREGNTQPPLLIQKDGWDSVTNLTALSTSGSKVEDIGHSRAGVGAHLDTELYRKLRTKYWYFSKFFVLSGFESNFHFW